MDRQETAQKIVKLVAEQLSIKPEQINEQSTMESLGADSLDRVEIVMNIEEMFGIDINDEEAEKLQTIGQAIDYVHLLRTKK
jgi:acyl carrier protein